MDGIRSFRSHTEGKRSGRGREVYGTEVILDDIFFTEAKSKKEFLGMRSERLNQRERRVARGAFVHFI